VLPRRHRGDHQRRGAEVERLAGGVGRTVDVGEGHVADGQQAPVDAAELDDAAVVAGGQRVRELDVVAPVEPQQRAQVRRREDELAGEAEEVEGLRPVAVADGAEGDVVLAEEDLLRVLGPELRIVLLGQDLVEERRALVRLQRGAEGVPVLGVGVVLGVAGRLEDVRVGVVDGAAFDVGHGRNAVTSARPVPVVRVG
jgi:hypothetical protein